MAMVLAELSAGRELEMGAYTTAANGHKIRSESPSSDCPDHTGQ